MTTNDWSVPETDVFDRIRAVLDNDDDAVLATVVAVAGSAYRRPGARMLIDPEGGGAGSITAGCLEDEVRALARDVLAAGQPRVETWDLTGREDDEWGMGVGCNGVVTVLLEPLDASMRPVATARNRGENVGVATIVGGKGTVGERTVYRPESGFEDAQFLDKSSRETLGDHLDRVVTEGVGTTVDVETAEGTVEVFVEGVRAPPELVVFGSGHDVAPVVELAKQVDFRVTVVTFRGARADESRYPRADTVISASPRDVADLVEWDEDTYVVLMTHNFVDDRLTLEGLVDTPVPYIGLMGPRKRFDEMEADLREAGVTLTAAQRERVYTPIGLSLSGDTPYQIALSIVSELLAVANDRTPEHLSRRGEPIHDRVEFDTD